MVLFRPRRSVSIGKLRLNLTRDGRVSSASVRSGRVTRNLTRGTTSVSTPLGSLLFGGKKKRRR